MIFAKVDVCVYTHTKFIRAGVAAVGYWTGALAYSRDHELDGFLPKEAVGIIFGLGEKEGRKLADQLVAVGLFEREGEDYRICNYAEKNETKEQIDARRASTRTRVKRHRSGVAGQVTHAITTPVTTLSVPGSDSDSGSDSEIRSGASAVPSFGDDEAFECRVALAPYPAERYIQPTDKLTAELRAIADMATVQDIDAAWLQFCGHYAGKWLHVTGWWQKWCVTAAKRERVDRDRRFAENRPKEAPLELPGLVQKRRDDEREKRLQQDAEWAQRKREAVPPPMADLLAALKPKEPS